MDDNMLLGKDNELSEEMNRTDYIYMVSRRNLIISLNAELDHHLADEMREVIDEIIDERGVNRVIIDFSKVGFMDSAGIGLITFIIKNTNMIVVLFIFIAYIIISAQ